MTKGKIFLIEGSDCSFKETNTIALYEKLKAEGFNVRHYHFPNYESPSASLVKMYLNGEISDTADDINPYVASQFYAVDRVASYIKEWKDFYLNGGIIILDRYVESNSIHQGGKISDKKEKDEFLDWLHHLEYDINGLPRPDVVFFMNMPPEVAQEIIATRNNKINNSEKKDIHEKNPDFLKKSYENAIYVANKYGWTFIDCVNNNKIRSKEAILEDLYSCVKNTLG